MQDASIVSFFLLFIIFAYLWRVAGDWIAKYKAINEENKTTLFKQKFPFNFPAELRRFTNTSETFPLENDPDFHILNDTKEKMTFESPSKVSKVEYEKVLNIDINPPWKIDIDQLSNLITPKDALPYKWVLDYAHGSSSSYPVEQLIKPKAPEPPIEPIEVKPYQFDLDRFDLPRFQKNKDREQYLKIYKSELSTREQAIKNYKKHLEWARKRNSEIRSHYDFLLSEYQRKLQTFNQQWDEAIKLHNQYEAAYKKAHDTDLRWIKSDLLGHDNHDEEGLFTRIKLALKYLISPLPSFEDIEIDYKPDEKILIVEMQFPDVDKVSFIKYVDQKNGPVEKPANKSEEREANLQFYPSLALRYVYEICRVDIDNLIDGVAINGWITYLNKKTGNEENAFCCSLFTTKDDIQKLNLARVDPREAFRALKGIISPGTEFAPVAPVVTLNKDDSRFVGNKDVLEGLNDGENLATMDWEDFEHLCRELFEKAFSKNHAEVKVTQASRDQGVDAVIFDPDPIYGGKIVVQAKRYTNTVDVSAVRDLYGTILNEGAMKGLLVTTSQFGSDSYQFAKDKPISLIDGNGLLHLLQEYGYKMHIDLVEAKRINNQNS